MSSNSLGQVLPDYDPTAVKTTYFIPSKSWANETVSWFSSRVRSRGGAYAEPLVETYQLAVNGVFSNIMQDYRTLLQRLTRQDAARTRLICKLTKAGIELPEKKEDLTANEMLAILEDFQKDEVQKLGRDNAVGGGFALGAGVLKTLVAWPFFANVLEGSGFTGLMPSALGLLGAAFAAMITTGAIWWWYRSLLNLFPTKPVAAMLSDNSTVMVTEEDKKIGQVMSSLNRSQQMHPMVSGIILLLMSVALCFLWLRWREVDFFTLVNRFHIAGDVAVAMAAVLVSLLMLAGLVGVMKKEGHSMGRRRIDEVNRILRQWMADEISNLYENEVDRETYNAVCSRKDWAAQRILRIGLLVVWKDTTQEDMAELVKNEIISVREQVSTSRLQIA